MENRNNQQKEKKNAYRMFLEEKQEEYDVK